MSGNETNKGSNNSNNGRSGGSHNPQKTAVARKSAPPPKGGQFSRQPNAASVAYQKAYNRKKYLIIGIGAAAVIAVIVIAALFIFGGDRATAAGGRVSTNLSAMSYGTITVEAGSSVTWTINVSGSSGNGCIRYMKANSELGIGSKTLSAGANSVKFTAPSSKGTYKVWCASGHFSGTVIVK
ncbi:MAG: hypothetical protein LBS99_05995 [Clostridiales bacterium]|jgi:plastocyanin|nr:hypothetical protein [Clostridiales bacterium]